MPRPLQSLERLQPMPRFALIIALFSAGFASAAAPVLKTKPGDLFVDPPTLINLGFEWLIEGDDNRSASVAVAYRRTGTTQWKQALPLLRLQKGAHLPE